MTFAYQHLGVAISVIYSDTSLLEFRVSASNGAFAGQTKIYASLDEPLQIAAALEGFPRTHTDTREVMVGVFGCGRGGGALQLKFYCVNQSAHAFVTAQIESDPLRSETLQSACLTFRIEAAGVDTFVADLRRLGRESEVTAVLPAVPET